MTTVRTGEGQRSSATVETVGRKNPDAHADCGRASEGLTQRRRALTPGEIRE